MTDRRGAWATPPLVLTMGEPAGIGAEITMMAWLEREQAGLAPFFVIDDIARLQSMARRLSFELPIEAIDEPENATELFDQALPVLPLGGSVEASPGVPDARNAPAVIQSIDRATALALSGRTSGMVTNPIYKHVLHEQGFAHPGHTEYLAERAGVSEAVMMLLCPGLRVVPVTIHLALKEALGALSERSIVERASLTATALHDDFGIANPRLAIAGLNPHAGEGGDMGREEIEIIAPAVARLKERKIDAFGPVAADSLFHAAARARYDAAICMYHDQALIPLKTIDFERGVNVTLGLPFVRTSPDHGTALGLAGTGRASPSSLIAAIQTAAAIAERRGANRRA